MSTCTHSTTTACRSCAAPERVIALSRGEDAPCERGTIGCCIDHSAEHGLRSRHLDGGCETW